jgi:GAF domain
MEKFLDYLKDPEKRSKAGAILFFAGIFFSTISLFYLPDNLVFEGGMKKSGAGLEFWVFAKAYIVIALTLAFGVVSITAATRVKREVIVFKEKNESVSSVRESSTENTNSLSVDVQAFSSSIKNSKPDKVLQFGLSSICQSLQASQGAFYLIKDENGKQLIEMKSGFALTLGENEKIDFEIGEGLVGQAVSTGKSIYLDEMPESYTNAIISGLGTAPPKFLFVTPIKKENKVKAVMEIATFSPLNEGLRKQAEEMALLLAERI